LGFATRNTSEVRDEWRNTPSKAKSDFTMHKAELKKTAGGPAHKAPSSQLETVIALYQDSASFKGIDCGLQIGIYIFFEMLRICIFNLKQLAPWF
jgi:hypothetical protein